MVHDESVYLRWQEYYKCIPQLQHDYLVNLDRSLKEDKVYCPKPAAGVVVPITVTCVVPLSETDDGCDNHWHLSCHNEWIVPMPIISLPMVRMLLGHAHAYTTVGLEVQASAYSCGTDRAIRYLGIFPQINGTSSVSEDASSEYPDFDAVTDFQHEDQNESGDYFQQCWIHTHPRHRAYMCEKSGATDSFSMVILPRIEGLNVLFVRLTEFGKKEIEQINNQRSQNDKHLSSRE